MVKEQKCKNLENVLQEINAKHIALNKDEVRRNNEILDMFLNNIIENLENNEVFEELYTTRFYGGSYYDGLKVAKPDEYDMDLLLKLPKLTRPKLYTSDEFPGHVQVQLENMREYERQPYAIPGFAKTFLDDNHCLSTKQVRQWMKSLVVKALNQFSSNRINTPHGIFKFRQSEGGPALTVKLVGTVDAKEVEISVDLVPCFVFTDKDWPEPPFRQNEDTKKNEFFIVPKQPDPSNLMKTTKDLSTYWRMSFQQQEGSLMNGFYHLKPALKLIKRLRDVWDHKCISSYYIKTIFLWEVREDKTLWNKPLSYVFLTMLKKYKETLENCRIDYYWNQNNNLLEKPKPETLRNFANKIQRVIKDIEYYPEDPSRVLKHMVKPVPESVRGHEDPFNDIIENLDLNSSDETNSAAAKNDSWCVIQ